VITGYNTDIKYKDVVYHVQTEDKGKENPTIESLIYAGGRIIASRRYDYAWLLDDGYSDKAVQQLLDGQHRKMMRDVRGGKFDPEGPPPFGAGIITDRSFDEVVLEFIGQQSSATGIGLVLKADVLPRAGDPSVLDLMVRSELDNKPIAGAEVAVRAMAPRADRAVTLFEGITGEDGGVRAGVDIPRELTGGTLFIEATSPLGTDALSLEILPA